MAREKEQKKIGANWLRKGGFALTALAVLVLFVFAVDAALQSDLPIPATGIPDKVMYLLMGAAVVCGGAVFLYQILSILLNRMVLRADGIEIKRLFHCVYIPKEDIIRIAGIHERVIGAATQNRTVFKIITNGKTYEVNSHEFFGLRKAIAYWEQHYMEKREEEEHEN